MPRTPKPPAKPTREPKFRKDIWIDQPTVDRLAAIQAAQHLDSMSATIRWLSRQITPVKTK